MLNMKVIALFATPISVAALMLCQNLLAADSQSSEGPRTKRSIEMYFLWNGLNVTNASALRVGMKLEDAIKLIDEPTSHWRDEKLVDGKPQYPFEGWLRWYHDPRQMHVAPYIRLRIEKGIVKELKAGRS
jgi:hypothetical protein